MDTMLTVEEVAAILKVQPLTVRQMLREGRIRGFKIGKAWRTTLSILEDDIACMSRGQKPPRLEQVPPDPDAPVPKKRGRKPRAALAVSPVAESSIQSPAPEPVPAEPVPVTSVEEPAEAENASAETAKRKKKAADTTDQQLLF